MPGRLSKFGRHNYEFETYWTLTFVFLFLLIFKTERFLVSLSETNSPNNFLTSIEFPLNLGVHLLSPLLHSSATHITTNIFWFVIFAAILEQRVELRDYIAFILGVGIIGNFVAPFLGQLAGFSVVYAIGVSGATNALTARETIFRAGVLSDSEQNKPVNWLIFILAAFVTLLSAQIVLYGKTQAGNSAIAHGVGLLFGLIFGIAELRGFCRVYDRLSAWWTAS